MFEVEPAVDDSPAPAALRGVLFVQAVEAEGLSISSFVPTTCYMTASFEGDVKHGGSFAAVTAPQINSSFCFEVCHQFID